MRLELEKYNVILSKDGESTIGFSDDIIKLYKDYIKQLVDDMQDETMVEDLKDEIDMILDMLSNIYAKSDEWYEPQMIRVFYNSMGAYQFKEIKECE